MMSIDAYLWEMKRAEATMGVADDPELHGSASAYYPSYDIPSTTPMAGQEPTQSFMAACGKDPGYLPRSVPMSPFHDGGGTEPASLVSPLTPQRGFRRHETAEVDR